MCKSSYFDRTAFRVNLEEPTLRNIPRNQQIGRLLRPGDLLIEKSGGGELQPVGTVVIYDQHDPAVCSNFIARVEVREGYDPRFLTYLHGHLYSIGVNKRSIKQTTGIQNLDSQSYFDEFVGVPPLPVQKSIARFLDRKTATIDTLIAKKQRLIQLLKEKRTALINQAVTKGLNPNAPMKDSSIPWIGEIPEHWEIMPLKFLTTHITSGSRGWAQYYTEQGAVFLRITNLSRKFIELNLEDIQYVQPPLGSEGERSRVQLGDLLISITAYIGTVGVVTQNLGDAYVNQHVALTRPRQDLVNPQWLGWCLFSSPGQHQFNRFLNGSTKDGLGLEDIKDLFALVPPINEQVEIVDAINQKVLQTVNLINAISKQIEKLQEYRRSLITAAVTGKLNTTQEETP
ncbi:restriction endonuclease subunit S [Gloeocapsopsis dulcis]|uniref:restriction endonuclease subunit S n=1 Tax=Gloeocapsopsis dulcis TaxID=2859516 RepID=UPI0018C51E4D|nr:restriction endonuclease subunit S [Gloeocapsopsis dulcis]WNN88689.1 restriction endonuclease subunit S [Gloeocapsopsis dulcis]